MVSAPCEGASIAFTVEERDAQSFANDSTIRADALRRLQFWLVRLGSVASDENSQRLRPMSALPPIASEFPQRRELTRSASSGHCRHSPNGRLWNVGATMKAYSALMLAARITLPHFSVSSAMSLPKSAGEPASAMPPRSARCAFNLGSARPALISLLSFSTISAGANRALGWRATGCEHFDRSGRHERPRELGVSQ